MDSDTACPKGGEHKLVEDIPGEKSCTKCGITIKVHEGTGDNPLIDEHGIGSNIGKDDTERHKITPFTKFVPGSSFKQEVALADRQIEIASGDLLPHTVQNRALALFKKTRKPLKGKNFETFVGACVFIACREQGIAIHTLAKSKLFSWKDAKLVRYYKEICNYLEINLPPDKAINNVEWIGKRVEYDIDTYSPPPERPFRVDIKFTHIPRRQFKSDVGSKLPDSVIREATKLLSKIPDSETGSNQVGIAAATLWIVSVTSNLSFTQKQFANAAGVNPQTVSKSAKRLSRIIKKNKLGKYVDPSNKYHQRTRAGKYLKGKDEGRKQKNSRSAKWLKARRRRLLDGTS